MKKIIVIITLLCLSEVMAQQTTDASGGNAAGTGGSSSYSVGQITYNSISSGGSVSQGVQQPFEIATLGNDEFPEITLQISIYPNPTTSFINLNIENHSMENILYQLFDINGKQIQMQSISSTETQISMEHLASAIYLLNVIQNNKIIKSFKIIKHN